jgi:predicted GNAT superfamily acetyltransferase
MYSHMLGVRSEYRGGIDLGWYLKVLQGYLALKEGFDEMTWTVDPMRGANARLNQEKLAATATNLTLDKYGVMRSTLYGNVPTDRFTNMWDMRSSLVHERLQQIRDRAYTPLRPCDLAGLPEATVENAAELRAGLPLRVVYRLPGDIDQLMRDDPQRAVDWRNEMRAVLGTLMTRRAAIVGDDVAREGPIAIRTSVIEGPYDVTGFATEVDETGQRESLFLLERKVDQS